MLIKLKSLLTVCLMGSLLAGCSFLGAEQKSDYCQLAKPIYVGKPDYFTDQTARQILTHNLTGQSICGWGRA